MKTFLPFFPLSTRTSMSVPEQIAPKCAQACQVSARGRAEYMAKKTHGRPAPPEKYIHRYHLWFWAGDMCACLPVFFKRNKCTYLPNEYLLRLPHARLITPNTKHQYQYQYQRLGAVFGRQQFFAVSGERMRGAQHTHLFISRDTQALGPEPLQLVSANTSKTVT